MSWQPQAPSQPQAQPQPPQPHPTVPYGQDMTAAPNGQQQFQQQVPQPAQAIIDPNAIIDGPNVPAELRGRRFGQVMQIYSALATDWMQRNQMNQSGGTLPAPRQAPATPEPQGRPVAPQQSNLQQAMPQQYQPARQQPQQYQPPQREPEGQRDWRDEIRNIVSEVVQPMTQVSQAQQIQQARDLARMNVPDFADLEADVMAMLSSAPPAALTNPSVWENTADLIRGKRARAGMVRPPQGQPMGLTQQPMALQQPQRSVPAQQTQIPQYQFFVESPTPPTLQTPSGMITPMERAYAQKMGMSDQEYIAWRGGVIR